jgi:DNA-binding MarR family transcriptional regulator
VVPKPAEPAVLESEGRQAAAGLSRIPMALRQRAWRGAHGRALTPTQGQALARLSRGACALAELARTLGVTPATASDAVATLQRKGLVRKERDPRDRRRLAVELTARGAVEAGRVGDWPAFLAEAVGVLSASERAALLRGLSATILALQCRGQIPGQAMCASCRYFQAYRHADVRKPHHCDYVDAPFGDGALRLECAEHELASNARLDEIAASLRAS